MFKPALAKLNNKISYYTIVKTQLDSGSEVKGALCEMTGGQRDKLDTDLVSEREAQMALGPYRVLGLVACNSIL